MNIYSNHNLGTVVDAVKKTLQTMRMKGETEAIFEFNGTSATIHVDSRWQDAVYILELRRRIYQITR